MIAYPDVASVAGPIVYPEKAGAAGLEINSDDYRKHAFLILLLESWELDYELKTVSAKAIRSWIRNMFKSDYARPWWAVALREVWNDSTVAKGKGILCVG